MSGGESKVSPLLEQQGVPAVESARTSLGPLGTAANKPAERTLRVISPMLANSGQGLTVARQGAETTKPTETKVLEGRTDSGPAVKISQAFAFENADSLEDNRNG